MSKICNKCGKMFPTSIKIDGKKKNLCNRKFCLECSPFGSHNTSKEPNGNFCHKHGVVEFSLNKKGHRRCKLCRSEAVVVCRQKKKKKLVELFGGCCKICGYKKCPQALQFHHLDPNSKKYNISQKGHCRKWEEVLAEANKCILVCANCHAEIENGILK